MTGSPRSRFRLPHWGRFLLATLVLAIATAGLSIWLPYHREQQVIRKIESWSGQVSAETGGPGWLRQLVGEDRMSELKVFDRIDFVSLSGTAVTDANMSQLKGLTNLKRLSLQDTALTDAGLIYLSGLTNLEDLSISYTAVTDSGLVHLRGCTNLKLLRIGATLVTEKGNAELKKAIPYCKIRY
jgi:hypothetical protein